MLWPHAGRRHARNVEIEQRVAAARRDNPEAEGWLRLLESALAESADGPAWGTAALPPSGDRPVKAPLLSRARISIEARAARKWVHRLLKLAAPGDSGRVDGVALLEAALDQDDARLDALAGDAGLEPHLMHVVGQVAVLPLLRACAEELAGQIPSPWWEGYCPLCGAWPVLAEYTGLERARQLRCARCGTGWAIPVLRCAFCDETDHERLGYLTPDGEQTRRVEVCNTCKGYLKATTTIRPLAAWAILLDDLTTVPLDVAAFDRGFRRPERPGYALDAELVEGGGGQWRVSR